LSSESDSRENLFLGCFLMSQKMMLVIIGEDVFGPISLY